MRDGDIRHGCQQRYQVAGVLFSCHARHFLAAQFDLVFQAGKGLYQSISGDRIGAAAAKRLDHQAGLLHFPDHKGAFMLQCLQCDADQAGHFLP